MAVKPGTGTGTGKKSKNDPKLDDFRSTQRAKSIQID